MKLRFDISEQLIKHRTLFVGFLVTLTVFLLLLLNLGSWNLIQQMGDNLEKELDSRLFALADIAANRISFEFEDYPKSDFFFGLLIEQTLPRTLKKIKRVNQLQAVFLIDEDYNVLADDREQNQILNKRTDVQIDSLCLFDAWQNGLTTVSKLHVFEGNRFKSAYAPIVTAEGETAAVLVIEASASFFDMIEFFQKGLVLTVIISVVILVIFSLFLFAAISFLLKSYESMRRSERLAMMGQMSASVAHEIRNPLSIIKSTGDVLKDMYNNQQNPNELFDFIPSEVKRLNRIVTDLLTFAREPKLDLQPSDINATVEGIKLEVEQDIDSDRIEISTRFGDGLRPFNFDADAIHQVLTNMLLNAVQAIKDSGKITITVDAISAKGNPTIRIEIADTGCGIPGEVDKIFDPFFTTKTKGTGLGLAISRQLIEKHGGWIDVESKKNVGTKIRIYLPA